MILNNYVYFGHDNINEKNKIVSPFLDDFLNANPNTLISQIGNNSNQYFGVKSKK